MKINIVSLLSFLSIVSTSEGFTPSSCVSHWNSPTAFTITTHIQSLSSKRGGNECVLRMAEDDEVEVTDPLNEGVESVSWLPSLKEQPTSSSETPEVRHFVSCSCLFLYWFLMYLFFFKLFLYLFFTVLISLV